MQPKLVKSASSKAEQFKESVIREMTRLALEHKAVNLAQGLPDFPCPDELKKASIDAINDDINQYAITWGDRHLREEIANKSRSYLNLEVDPEKEITVACGATEAMISSMLALVDPGEEVIVFEPFYENYGPDAILSGAKPRYVSLNPPDWSFDPKELEKAFSNKTRAIIINTPHNPTGKVFKKEELAEIARLCQKWGVIAFTDEIYEHILYDGAEHIALASLDGMKDFTVTINSLSKTYSVTGWRVGWAIAPESMTSAIRKVHDFLTVGAPAPLQRAGACAIRLPEKFYKELEVEYIERRAHLLETLDQVGIEYFKPEGAYYAFSNIESFGYENDVELTKHLVRDIGVAVVPGSSFFSDQKLGKKYIRFCFSRRMETLEAARERLLKFKK